MRTRTSPAMLASMVKLAAVAAALTIAAWSLALPASAAPQSEWDHVDRVVVFGDLHGDYGKFHDMLLKAGLIDAHDNWAGGKTHFVQVGDVPDRAPDTRKIVDLLIKLEPQARRAGGYVHALIGDHEAMNMEEDNRYTTPGEYAAFATANSATLRDRYYALVVADLTAHPPPGGVPTFDAAYRKAFDDAHPLGWVEHQVAWSNQGYYGRWVMTHSAVIRIDDAIYMHGGLGPAFAQYDDDTLNAAVIAALKHAPEKKGGPHDILWAEDGPLWYRGLANHPEATEAANVQAILAAHHVSHIVVGHTKQYPYVNTRFDGAVVLTDVFFTNACEDPHAFLIKQGDRLSTVYRGHTLELPAAGVAHDAYLAKIAAIDAAAPLCPGPPAATLAPGTAPPPPTAPATPPASPAAPPAP